MVSNTSNTAENLSSRNAELQANIAEITAVDSAGAAANQKVFGFDQGSTLLAQESGLRKGTTVGDTTNATQAETDRKNSQNHHRILNEISNNTQAVLDRIQEIDDQLAIYNARLAELERQMAENEREIARFGEQIEGYDATLIQLDEDIVHTEAQIEEEEQEIDVLTEDLDEALYNDNLPRTSPLI